MSCVLWSFPRTCSYRIYINAYLFTLSNPSLITVGAVLVDDGTLEYKNFFTAMFAVIFGAFGVGQVCKKYSFCTSCMLRFWQCMMRVWWPFFFSKMRRLLLVWVLRGCFPCSSCEGTRGPRVCMFGTDQVCIMC